MKKLILLASVLSLLAGCADDADVASKNIIKAADNFEVNRRIVFYNGITDNYILSIEGKCSMDVNGSGRAFNVICKTGPSNYKRHTLVLSDNVTAFVEQLDSIYASAYHYRFTVKPEVILPEFDLRTEKGAAHNE